MSRSAHAFFLILVLLPLVIVACDGGCDKNLPEAHNGPNGEGVSFAQLTDGATAPCAGLQSGTTCFFTVNFAVTGVSSPVTARLLVSLDKLANGDDVCDESPIPQGTGVLVMPNQGGGQLQGQLGPPVTNAVRFDLVIELLDSTGRVIAASTTVHNLSPG